MIVIAIHITGFSESPISAIRGILANKSRVNEVRFIYPSYQDDKTSMYPEWSEHRKELEDANVGVYFDATLNADNLSNGSVVVEVPPYCELKLGAFESISKEIGNANMAQTHFALSTSTKLRKFSLLYGFLVVLTVIDWLWNRFYEHNKLVQYTDVRGRFLLRKGQRRFLPKENEFTWRLWNSQVMPKVYAGDTAILSPPPPVSGWSYIVWLLHTHKHLGMGFWIAPFSAIWGFLSISWFTMLWNAIIYRSFWLGGYATSIWAIEICISFLICGHYIRLDYKNVFYVLFPVYFMLFPFMLMYSKLTTPQVNW